MDDYDWLQNTSPTIDLTGDDEDIDEPNLQAHQAFFDAEAIANATFMHSQTHYPYSLVPSNANDLYSQHQGTHGNGHRQYQQDQQLSQSQSQSQPQPQNSYSSMNTSNKDTGHCVNPNQIYSQPQSNYVARHHQQLSDSQKQPQYLNLSRSSSHQSELPQHVQRQSGYPGSSQHIRHPSQMSPPGTSPPSKSQMMYRTVDGSLEPTPRVNRNSGSPANYSETGQSPPVGYSTTIPTPHELALARLEQYAPNASQKPASFAAAIAGHHLQPQYSYAETQRQFHQSQVHQSPLIAVTELQRASPATGNYASRPPSQQGNTSTAQSQTTYSGQHKQSTDNFHQSQFAVRKTNRSPPPVQETQTGAVQAQASPQSPVTDSDTDSTQAALHDQIRPPSRVSSRNRNNSITDFEDITARTFEGFETSSIRSTLEPHDKRALEIEPAPQFTKLLPTEVQTQSRADQQSSGSAVPQKAKRPANAQSSSVNSPPVSAAPPQHELSFGTGNEIITLDSASPTASSLHSDSAQPDGRQQAQSHSQVGVPPAKFQRLNNGKGQPVAPPSSKPSQSMPSGLPNELQQTQYKIVQRHRDLIQLLAESSALAKTSYDPATIARDVLISIGKHPTEQPLNHHLEHLRDRFYMKHGADMETFRWDIVDAKRPGSIWPLPAHAPSAPAPTPLPFPPPRFGPLIGSAAAPIPISGRLLVHESFPFSRQYSGSINTGKVPPPQFPPKYPAPAQAPAAAPAPAPAPAPARVPAPARGSAPTATPRPPTMLYSEPYISSRDRTNRPMPNKIVGRAPPKGPSTPPTSYSHSAPLSGLPSVSSKLTSAPQYRLSTPIVTPTVSIPSTSHRNSQPHARLEPSAAFTAFQQKTSKFTPDKHSKAQPAKPQTKSDHLLKSPEAHRLPPPQVVIPPSPVKMTERKKPGRPSKKAAGGAMNVVEVQVPRGKPVTYPIFACQWEECISELHNLDAFRSHLVKTHIPHHLQCKWKGCANTSFMAAADMFSHVSTEHVSKLAWELGDGPAVPETAEISPNQPSSMFDPGARRAVMSLPVEEHQLDVFAKTHGKNTDKAKANALLDAGRQWKQQVGPEMDRDGRRLSTPARQLRTNAMEHAFISP